MKSFVDYLSQYAAYHRDKRNIATHFVGIPMIVVAVAILLSRPVLMHFDGIAISPALIVVIITALFSGNFCDNTDPGVLISTGSGGLNLVAMMKKDRIRKAISTNGVMSVAVLFFGILTLGMSQYLVIR